MDYGSEPNGRDFDRRAFIKRAGVVSAATVWAAPTVQSLVAPAFATGTPRGACTACLTGGGQIVGTTTSPVLFNGVPIPKLSFGLGQICCEGQGPTTIEVNAHPDNRPQNDISWHFDENLVVTCTKTGDPSPPPRTADCANRFTGTAEDGDGNTLSFVFEDNGEPGQMVDFVSISISGPQGTLSGTGLLDRGNLQVHEGLGPVTRDCSGC
ncbi:MAG: hypothetical protein M3211_02425 [Actinomycetota bacterium]|nr:hypothetical protein [Actinomycetota bacterium]